MIKLNCSDVIIDTTIETVTGGADVHDEDTEEVITKLIEDNEKQEERIANSLEEVIVDLNEFVYDATITESTDTTHNFTETETTEEFETTTTTHMHIDDLSDPDALDPQQQPIVTNFITQQALAQLNDANLTDRDASILTALLELEILKGEQKDTTAEINIKLQQLERLLSSNSNNNSSNHVPPTELIILKDDNKIKQKPRRGKTVPENVLEQKTSTVNLFQNIQSQLFNLLDERHKFLQIVSQKINAELHVIQQTVQILQQLINLKLNHGETCVLIRLLELWMLMTLISEPEFP